MGGHKSSPATQTTNPSTVWNPQAGYLQDMYSQAQNTYRQQSGQQSNPDGTWSTNPNFVSNGQQALNQYGTQLGQASNTLGQAGNTFQGAYGQMQQAGQGYQQGYAGLNDQSNWLKSFQNVGIDPMADVYARNVGNNFREQIMPALQGQQMLSGGYGGSRGQIGEGLAGARAGQQLQDFNAQLYDNQMNRSLQAAQGLGQNALGYGSLAQGQGNLGTAMGNLGSQRTALGNAFGSLGGQYGQYANMQNAQPWEAVNHYAGLLGNPSVMSGGGTAQGAQAGSSGGLGTAIGIAGLVAAPFTGGASLALAAGANAAVSNYYK